MSANYRDAPQAFQAQAAQKRFQKYISVPTSPLGCFQLIDLYGFFMKPKSRIYQLVKEWRQKPTLVTKETSQPFPRFEGVTDEEEQLKIWKHHQKPSYQAVLHLKTAEIKYVLHRNLFTAHADELKTWVYEGLLAAEYWCGIAKPKHLILPIRADELIKDDFERFMRTRLLNCHLPIGHLGIAITHHELVDESSLQRAIIEMRRLGVLIHLFGFQRFDHTVSLIETGLIESVQIDIQLFKVENPQLIELTELSKLMKHHNIPLLSGSIDLIKEREILLENSITYGYGSVIKPPMTASQIARIFKV